MEDKFLIGVDFGKRGGIVVLKNGKVHFKRQMFTLGDVETAEIDKLRIAQFLAKFKNKNVHLICEKFGGFFGYNKKAAVSLEGQKEAFLMAVEIMRIPYTCVLPTVWQKAMFAGVTVKKKSNGQKDTKKMALEAVRRLFPGENWLKSKRSSKPHDGMLDAALLAKYGERKNL